MCNWTEPTNCGVPDSGSRSCSAPLKVCVRPESYEPFVHCAVVFQNGTIFLVGAQLMDGRDPLVLSLSDDGVTFDRAFWVRDHCPPMRYPGSAKEPGYQVWDWM